jgi:phage baseplate assembly protein W
MIINGTPYPIVRRPQGLLSTVTNYEAIKADLLQLLLTNPGERVMLPDFGTPLRSLLFEQNNANLANKARSMIIESIRNWEPRIVVTDITVKNQGTIYESGMADPDSLGNELYISITFSTPDNIKQTDTLVLQLPVGAQ